MSDIKLSQLPNTTALDSSDLFPISKNLGGGNWQSNSITAHNVLNALSTGTRILKVSKEGTRDSDTIKDAISKAVALSPTSSSPVSIQVFPGTYIEENPISIPPWVSIYSERGQFSAVVVANNDGNIFVGNGNSQIDGFTIMGLPSFSNIGYISSVIAMGLIKNCIIQDCYTGISSIGGYITSNNNIGICPTRVMNSFLESTSVGLIIATSNRVEIQQSTAHPVNGCYCHGAASEIYLYDCLIFSCINGMYVNNDGYVECASGHFEDCVNAIHIGPNGSSNAKCVSTIIEDADTYDLFVESPTAGLSYVGALDSRKFSIVSGATVTTMANDARINGGLITGQTSMQDTVNIGTPGALFLGKDVQVNIGDGGSFSSDSQGNPIVEYWSYDASQPSGSKFSRFSNNAGSQLTEASDAIIVGCKYPFPSIKLTIDVAANLGSSDIATEYWNGSSWTRISVAAYRRSDFATRSNTIFQNVETQYVEFSTVLNSNADWDAANNVLDEIPLWSAGEDFYAIRFRNDGALTSGMQFSIGEVKPDSFVVSSSGHKANFGIYRTDKIYFAHYTIVTPDPINPPERVDLQMSPNITFSNVPSFLKANAISKVSTAFVIPPDIDTASPIQIFINGNNSTANMGNVSSSIFIARIPSLIPETALPLTDIEFDQLTPSNGYVNGIIAVRENIDISSYQLGDVLILNFTRFGTDISDDYNGDFLLRNITLKFHAKFV